MQVLRTYPDAHFEYDFAPHGERSIARGYTKAVPRARRLIYLEDQYLWSKRVAQLFAQALRDNPDLHLVAVVPRHPDVDGRLVAAAQQDWPLARRIETCCEASPRPGARVRCREPRGHAGVRARQGLRHRRCVGVRRQRQPQSAVMDA